MRGMHFLTVAIFALLLGACGGEQPATAVLVINEVVAQNEGVAVDENGELDDWLELVNTSAQPLNLSDYTLEDSDSGPVRLPARVLAPGELLLLWADDGPEQGDLHLPFKISSGGETLTLRDLEQAVVARLEVPALKENEAFARFPSGTGDASVCRYASPGKNNGNVCQSQSKPSVSDDVQFAGFDPAQWAASSVPQGLAISEMALRPAQFIEFQNYSASPIALSDYALVLGALGADSGLPSWQVEAAIALPATVLGAGERVVVPISDNQLAGIAATPEFEGVAVLYGQVTSAEPLVVDAVPFMAWPSGNALARQEAFPYPFQFCQNTTEQLPNLCEALVSRPLGSHSRGLYTPSDFAALAQGSGLAGVASVKFVMDIERDGLVHYLSAERWPLHYTFVREVIEQLPALNRCDALENFQFEQGWGQFSQENYFNSTTRRYHLGTLSHHANANVKAVEYTFGDAISPEQMRSAFFAVTTHTVNPLEWAVRPQDAAQVTKARTIEGTLPLVSPKAPFNNVQLQALAEGVAYGTLTFVPVEALGEALLGPRTVVITDDVPNDIDFVGGLITEAFQTPLAHVNILSQGRGTPNLALPNARQIPEVQSLLNQLVRFEVTASGYILRSATLSEAEAFWAENGGTQEPQTPRLDASVESLVDLTDVGIEALPSIGAKAAQLAELNRVSLYAGQCSEGASFEVPEGAFAIPVAHYLAHFAASGAKALLETEMAKAEFNTDVQVRKSALEAVRNTILAHPVDAELLADVEARVEAHFGDKRVRFRSSSNTEDLSTFNGAGLYQSLSAAIGDPKRRVDDAIRTVWASLWNFRAFEERSFANVDQDFVAMGVLVHLAFRNERANGVAIARNVLNPVRADQYYVNSQAGEASVTNPAPGVLTEALVYQWPPRTPKLTYHSQSSLVTAPVLTGSEVRTLACAMSAIQAHFKPLLDPYDEDRWLTMESEFKFLGPERTFLIKQARPYPFGDISVANDCREIE